MLESVELVFFPLLEMSRIPRIYVCFCLYRIVKRWHLLRGVGWWVISDPSREGDRKEDIWPWRKHNAKCWRGRR